MRKIIYALSLCLLALGLSGCQSKAANTNANSSTPSNQSAALKTTEGVPVELQNPQDAAGYFALGNLLYKNDRDGEAVEAYKKSVELDPNDADAYRGLALAYAATTQKKESQEAFEKAVGLYEKKVREDAKDADAIYRLADSYGQLGEYEKAADAYRRASRLKEPDAPTYYDIGLVYNRLARYKDAADAFSKAVELDPNDYQSQEALDKAREDASKLRERIDYDKKMIQKQRAQNQNGSNQNSQNGAGKSSRNANQ
jgi:tetratricopeptide (TPR) repeat protein